MPRIKNKKAQPAKPEATPQPTIPITSTVSHAGEPWPPELLLQQAEKEPNRRPLADYADAIRVLRDEKSFTFREIAEWLKNFYIEANHNAVYREYTKGMPDDVAHNEALADEHVEREEAGLE